VKTALAYLCVVGLLSTTHSFRRDTDHQRLVLCAVALVLVVAVSSLLGLAVRRLRGGGKAKKKPRERGYAIVPVKNRGR